MLYFLRRPLSTIRNLKGSMYYKIFLENVLRLIQLYKEELDDFDLIVLALRQALWGNLLKPKYIDETLFTKQ